MKKYCLVFEKEKKLIAQANTLIAEGWRPLGGVVYCFDGERGYFFAQAFIREEENSQ